jgi:hypothetical protein
LSYTFDPTHRGDLPKEAFAHIQFRAIDAQGFYFDQNFAMLWNGRREVPENKLFRTTELVDYHCLH